jgi:hypothetical protein
VYVNAGAFTMTGGAISKSTASRGGGVYVSSSGTFTKAAGIIYGNDASDPLLANTATSGTGHAVYAGSSKKRDATADATVPLDSGTAGAGGGWD